MDLMLFNKQAGRIIILYVLTAWMSIGITYYISSSFVISIFTGIVTMVLFHIIISIYVSYWKKRLLKILEKANKKEARDFAENFATNTWSMINDIFPAQDFDDN